MKRNFEQFIAISLTIISSIFVVFLLTAIFNTDFAMEADNRVVHVLFIVFTIFFLILSCLNIYASFSNDEKVNQILLFKTSSSAKKASVGLIRKMAKQAVSVIKEVKISRINLFIDSNNNVILKANINIDTTKSETESRAKMLLEKTTDALATEFKEVLGLEFKEIELRLIKAKYASNPDAEKINTQPQTLAQEPKDTDEDKNAKLNSKENEEQEDIIKVEEPVVEESNQEVIEEEETENR